MDVYNSQSAVEIIRDKYSFNLEQSFPILYIILRNDLYSMTPGRALAQSSHIGHCLTHDMHDFQTVADPVTNMFKKWKKSTTQGFGTAIVLAGGTENDIIECLKKVTQYGETQNPPEAACNIVMDPDYGVRDGGTTHYVSLNVGAYVFCDKNNPILQDILSVFPLHP